jgi:hypothetical protein
LPGRTQTPPQVRPAVHARGSARGRRSPSGRLYTTRRPARIGRRDAAAVNGVADALAENYPNLARLLRTPTPAFCYFFRREVETNDEPAHGLFFDGLRQLSASQAKAFGEVGQALASLGGQFDALFEQLGRIEAAVEETHTVAVETHGVVLDMRAELQRFGGEARTLMEQVLLRLGQVGMARGEVRPGNSCSIRGEDERRAVKAFLPKKMGLLQSEWVTFAHFQISGSMQVSTLRRRYSSSCKPYARLWRTRILLFSPSTKPRATLFSAAQYAAIPSQWLSIIRANFS